MQAPTLFARSVAPLSLEQLADKLTRMLLVLPGNDFSVLNMAHKMVIETGTEKTDTLAQSRAKEVCAILIARAAEKAQITESTSDLFTTPSAIAEGALRDQGIRSWIDCRDLTPKVLQLMKEGPARKSPEPPRLPLDSTGLAIIHQAKAPLPAPRKVLRNARTPEPTPAAAHLLPEERMYWKRN